MNGAPKQTVMTDSQSWIDGVIDIDEPYVVVGIVAAVVLGTAIYLWWRFRRRHRRRR